ncbi:PfkB family carbohydrate kinase [Tessaracoccus sp. Z1128]
MHIHSFLSLHSSIRQGPSMSTLRSALASVRAPIRPGPHSRAPTTMLGAVGSDESRHTALRLLNEAGVDIKHVLKPPDPTGLAVVSVSSDGENTVVVVSGQARRCPCSTWNSGLRSSGTPTSPFPRETFRPRPTRRWRPE